MDAAIARYVTDWSGDKTLHPVDNWCGARVTTSTPTTRLPPTEWVATTSGETLTQGARRTVVTSPLGVPPLQRHRVAIAAAIGMGAGLLAYAFLARPGSGGDYFFVWRAARTLLAGQNPYQVVAIGPENPGNDVFLYPLPALLIIAPVAWLPLAVSGGVFLGIASAFLAHALLRDGHHRLPIFMGAPFLMAISLGQWSPLITAAALQSNLGFVFAAKPNLGLPAWIYRPNVRAVVGAVAILALSLAILPSWPLDWYHNVSSRPEKFSPIRTAVGPLLLLAALRWKRPESRLLLAMSCVPQALFFYDQLILGLVPRTFRQSLIFSLITFVLLLTWFYRLGPGDFYVQKAVPYALAIYFVALVMVLWPERNSAVASSLAPAPEQSKAPIPT
jgi:hypothetical protein